jgi:cysteine-rich repeat protein
MVCTSCPSGYYLSSGYCYPCEGTCLSCTGATALDCLTCQPDYLLKDGVCQKLTCSATQYVQSTYGCQDCASTFAKSLACISTGPTSCQSGYLLSNAQCLTCSQITGYTYDSASGKCKDKCGDGLLITDQCDDGNTLNGDGCSSTCQVESGWKCPNNVCQLVSAPEIWLITMSSFPRNHSLVLVVGLSVGVRLVEGNFILTFTSITQYSYQVTTLNAYWNRYMLVIEYFQSPQNEQLSISVKAPLESRVRLLQVPLGPLEPLPMDQEWTNRTEDVSSQRLLVSLSLNISLSLSVTVPVETSPPAIYITQTQSELYSKYLMLLVAVLQLSVLAVIIVALLMRLKVMLLVIDALNSLSVLFILSGPAVYNVTLASYQASVGLRRFFYPFGELLPDIGSSFYYFDYRSNFFSSSALQAATIVLCLLGTLFYQSCGKETDNPWYYYRTGFVFAFAYDLLLTSMAVFFCAPYNSYQSSYSWMFAVLSSIWLASEAVHYYRSQDDLNTGRKVVPAVSFITNELDNKEKSKVEQNIF